MDGPSPLTFPARVVILLAIVIAIGGTAADVWWSQDTLDGSFPLIAFAMYPFLSSAFFVILSSIVMRIFGIRFFNDPAGD